MNDPIDLFQMLLFDFIKSTKRIIISFCSSLSSSNPQRSGKDKKNSRVQFHQSFSDHHYNLLPKNQHKKIILCIKKIKKSGTTNLNNQRLTRDTPVQTLFDARGSINTSSIHQSLFRSWIKWYFKEAPNLSNFLSSLIQIFSIYTV